MSASRNFFEKTAVISPLEYIKIYETNADKISAVKMILPRIGVDNHFGKFEIEYNEQE